ncbi:MAG: hypothetical protein DMG28_02775 [Acidobacteria bacterium]|nr:MAG: hypothetical protein DMG28_02775 [Acidobacteriota bacterium]
MSGSAAENAWRSNLARDGRPLFLLSTYFVGSPDGPRPPWFTLLHGFPSSSWDYAKVLLGLEAEFRVVAFDFLGFGNSDKPRSSRYMIHQQADLTEAVWRHFSVRRTAIVAHDYGVSVAQELLACREQGAEAVEVSGITFLNGGLYADLHRPLAVQRLLRKPLVGRLISALANEWMFRRNFRKVFSHRHLPPRQKSGSTGERLLAAAATGLPTG